MLLSLVSHCDLELEQVYVNKIFLQNYLDEKIFMSWLEKFDGKESQACHLGKHFMD